MSTVESQRDELHAAKVRKIKDQSIIISTFKIDMPPNLGGLGEGNKYTTPLTAL